MSEPIAWQELLCQEIPFSGQPNLSFTTVNLLLASTITDSLKLEMELKSAD